MALGVLDEQEVVNILVTYLRDDGFVLGERHGQQAVTVAEDMWAFVKARLEDDQQSKALWSKMEDDPAGTAVELEGTIEALEEGDPQLAERLASYLEEYYEASRAETGGRNSVESTEDGEPEINMDDNLQETPLMVESADDEYATGTYNYGNIRGHDEMTGSNLLLEVTDKEKVDQIEDVDSLDVTEGEAGITDPVEERALPGLFGQLYPAVDEHPDMSQARKDKVKAELREMETQVARGRNADEEMLIRHARRIRRTAPDIADLLLPGLEAFAEEVDGPLKNAVRRMQAQDGDIETDNEPL